MGLAPDNIFDWYPHISPKAGWDPLVGSLLVVPKFRQVKPLELGGHQANSIFVSISTQLFILFLKSGMNWLAQLDDKIFCSSMTTEQTASADEQ